MSADLDRLRALLPGYDIGDELGRGAWAVVRRAHHRALHREVAVKILFPSLVSDPEVQARFAVEARLLAGFDHPHVVRIHDYVEQGDLCVLVLEFLGGGTVRDRMHTLAGDAACAIAIAASSALHAAHARGVLHRDVKPENLMFTDSGMLRLTDFGIAKMLGGGGASTIAGQVLGTLAYLAPEQVTGGTLTAATDVYALGTVLYELLSGRLPFPREESPASTLYRRAHEPPASLHDAAPQLPEGVAAAVMGALATDPATRHRTAEDFGVALADACSSAWGPGWVARSGVEVVAGGRLGASLGATSPHPLTAAGASGTTAPPANPVGAASSAAAAAGRGPGRSLRPAIPVAAGAVAVLALLLGVLVLHGRPSTSPPPAAVATVRPATTLTPTPAQPTPTPAPTLRPGRTVYSDPMNDPRTGWVPDAGQGAAGTVAFKADGYHVTLLQPNQPLTTFSLAGPFTPRLTSVTVTVNAVLVAGVPADGAGVRCDQGGGRAGLRYTFEIHPDGSWSIFKIDGNGSAALLNGTSAAIARGRAPNVISGNCTEGAGGQTALTLAVNGTVVGTTTDTHAAGSISWHGALVTFRDVESPGTEVRFTGYAILDTSSS